MLTSIVSVDPAANSHTAPSSTDVAATFDQNINDATATSRTFSVYSTQRGQLLEPDAAITTAGNMITVRPGSGFFPGETVQVTLTPELQSTTGEPAAAQVWQFRTAATGGTGVFADTGQRLGNSASTYIAIGDLDRDGDLDVFVAGHLANEVWQNDGSGVFSDSGQRFGNENENVRGASLGDIDGDGDLDAFVANTNAADRVWLNNGGGLFSDSGQRLGNHSSGGLSLGDLDGDGDLDAFVISNFHGIRIWLNAGGVFSNSGQRLGNRENNDGVSLGDIDGDGDLDAIVANYGENVIWLNNSAVFSDSGQRLGRLGSAVALGDVDADGDLDALLTSPSGSRVWLNNGGLFSDSGQMLASAGYGSLGDLDGDGDLDASVGDRIWLNDGGQFTDSGETVGGRLSLGDLDGDGDLDGFYFNSGGPDSVWLNQDPTTSVSLSADDLTIGESAGVATITVTLSATSTQAVTVDLDITGTAVLNDDYSVSATRIVIPAGGSSGAVTVSAVPDLLDEVDETVVVEITNVTNAVESGTQQVTILIADDDDPPTVDLTIDNAMITENGGAAIATARLSSTSGQDVTVHFASDGTALLGSDFELSAPAIVISAGATTGTNTITAIDDIVDEPNETVELTITATGATVGIQEQTVTIIDDDAPPMVVLAVDDENIPEDGGSATFSVTLSAPAVAPVTVEFGVHGSATRTLDYTLSDTQVVISSGDTTGAVTLTSLADLLVTEGPETVTLDIAAVSANATEAGEQSATVTIIDDVNGPEVTLTIDNAGIAENGGVATVTATLAEVFTLPVTADLGFSGPAVQDIDYHVSATQIIIPIGLTTGTISITGIADVLHERDETILVDILDIMNGDEVEQQQVTTTVVDDDDPPTVTLSVDEAAIAEEGGLATFTATLSSVSGVDATVELGISGSATQSSDFELSATQIMIAAGETTGSITVTAVQDSADDNNETVVVDITSATGAIEDGTQQQSTTITDDDDPELTLAVDNSQIAEDGGVAVFTSKLSSAATAPVTIDIEFSGTATVDADYTTSGSQITIAPGETTGLVAVTAVQDESSEPNETVIVEVSATTNAQEVIPQVAMTAIEDDDGPPLVTLGIDAHTIEEAGGVATVTARLSRAFDQPSTIALSFSGTAAADDYNTSATQIVIPVGSTSGSITITAADDGLTEGDQTVIVDIESTTGALEHGTQQVTTTILDDEPQPTVSFLLLSPATMPENFGQARLAVVLSGTTQSPVVIDLELTGTATRGDDYNGPRQLTIQPGRLNSTTVFRTINDSLVEDDETIVVTAASVTGAAGGGSLTLTIVDDDVVPEVSIEILDTALLESVGRTTLQVRTPSATLTAVTVDIDYSAGSAVLGVDFDAPPQITIPAGGFLAQAPLAAIPDTLDEDDEDVIARITSVTNATIGTDQAMTTITDDDVSPTVSISASSTEVTEGGTTSLTATLSEVSGREVIVDLGLAGTATLNIDYTVVDQIIIPAGFESASIEFAAVQDSLDEADETVDLSVIGATNAQAVGPQQLTLTILDDDEPVAPNVTLLAVPTEIVEEAGVSTFVASLSKVTSVPVTVGLAVVSSSTAAQIEDYSISALQITIAPGGTSGSVTVTAVQDEHAEPPETVTLEIATAVGGIETGEQSATVTILDDDALPTFQVTRLTPTSSGFIAELNADVDVSVLNLYDTRTANLGPPDVVLEGATTGVVPGSLVIDPLRRRVTFVKTGGPLSPDSYTVTLISGNNGFNDTAGNLLDGDGDGNAGDDLRATFEVAATDQVTVSLPDFVRGPGQEVHLPAHTNTGIPVMISSGTNVRTASIQISYDPTLLKISEASVGAAMPEGATVALDTSDFGTAIVTLSSPADLPAGRNVLLNLQASIPTENAIRNYGIQQVIELHNAVLMDASANATEAWSDDAVHLVSYAADVSSNGRINAADSAIVARVAALIDSGFGATLLADPAIAGDISGNGRVNAADASLVARFAALIDVPQIPPVPEGVVIAGSAANVVFVGRHVEWVPAEAHMPSAGSADGPGFPVPTNPPNSAVDLAFSDLERSIEEEHQAQTLEEALGELLVDTRASSPLLNHGAETRSPLAQVLPKSETAAEYYFALRVTRGPTLPPSKPPAVPPRR